jgi:glycosyltransferase involved in cell wall biosynthesis
MKILVLVSDLKPIGGIQKYNRFLIRALKESEINFKVVEVGRGRIKKILAATRFFWQVFSFRPDKIFCGHINFLPLALIGKKFNSKIILFVYGIDVWNLFNSQKVKLFETNKIVSISEFTSKKLIQQGIEKEKIFLLSPCVDGEFFRPHQELDLEGRIVLTVGRLEALEGYKGYELVMEAIAKLLPEFPELEYRIVGEGNDRVRLEKKAASLGLGGRIKFLGRVKEEDMPQQYSESSVFVMPSKGEGFGIVFLEALACGRPVIFGNEDASSEAAGNGEWGISINPDSVEELVVALKDLFMGRAKSILSQPEELRDGVLRRFGFGVFKEKVLDLINEL